MAPGRPLAERILNGQGPEFADLLETLGVAITVRDRDDRFIYANRAALRSLGVDTLQDVLGHPLKAILDRFIVHDADGRPVSGQEIPSVRLMRGEPAEPMLVHCVDRTTGEATWLILKVSGLRDADGEVVAAVTMIENVTAVKTAEVHTRLLAESGRILASSLDYQQTLRNVAEASIPGLADWCLVELVAAGNREQVVVAHLDPLKRPLAARMRELEPPEPRPESAITRVITTGDSEQYFDVTDAHLRRVAVSDEHLEVMRALEIRSAIVAPMRVRGRIIGAMSFFTSQSQRRLTEEDVAVAEQLARRAAVAVENARMHTTLARIAETLQQSLLPSALPEVPGWEMAALYRPALAEQRIEVGGDFYEVFDAGPRRLALLGDVTGHGVAAATLTALMRYGARFAGRLEPEPRAILARLDEELRERTGSAMCTALCAAIDDRRLVLSSAGHPPALHVSTDGRVSEHPSAGPLLGAFPDSDWPSETLEVAPGDLVLLYTDGITETVGPEDRFGTDRLHALASRHAGATPQQLLDALDAELHRFGGDRRTDDVTALALRPVG